MKALYYKDGLHYTNDYPHPERKPGEALVKVIKTGICATDLEIVKGYMGFKGVLGHEFIGVVEESEHAEFIEKRVVGDINCGCKRCHYCLHGLSAHCPYRTVLGIVNRDGAFAEYLTLPDENLHTLPENVSDDEAVFVEPLAAAFQILEQIHFKPHQRVMILGDGRLGIIITHVLATVVSKLTLAGKHSDKLQHVKHLNVDTLNITEKKIKELYDVVIDATGSDKGLTMALEIVKPGGTIVLKTTTAGDITAPLHRAVIHEVKIIGSRCGPFRPAIDALAKGTISLSHLISSRYPVEDSRRAFDKAREKSSLKVLIEMIR